MPFTLDLATRSDADDGQLHRCCKLVPYKTTATLLDKKPVKFPLKLGNLKVYIPLSP
jgi:hypothetical protein